MIDQKRREAIEKEVIKCGRCGNCRSICPVFLAENNENTLPRSKVRMMEAVLEDGLELTPGVQERFSKCLLCKACKTNCGSGVVTDKLILAARAATVERNGLPLVKRLAFTSLRYRRLFDLGLRAGAVFQGLLFKKLPDGSGRIPRIPLPAAGLNLRRVMPELTTRPLRSRLPGIVKTGAASRKGRVAFFTGCTIQYIYPQIGEAVVRILSRNGWDVVIPKEQGCCGTPAFTSGDLETGRVLAERNLQALDREDCDYIVTACASCGSALKFEYEHLLEDSPLREKWNKIAPKVYDIAQFIVHGCDLTAFGKLPLKVTYHDPCHLVRGMEVAAEPRRIMESIPGLAYTEMEEADTCCGAGGTFSAAYYELSRRINEKKLDHIEATGADYVMTGCPSCLMHITDGLIQRNSSVKAMHTAELIDMAYEAAIRGDRHAAL